MINHWRIPHDGAVKPITPAEFAARRRAAKESKKNSDAHACNERTEIMARMEGVGGTFSLSDIRNNYKVSSSTAWRIVRDLLRSKKIEKIGRAAYQWR